MQAIIAVFPLPVAGDVNGDGIGDLIVGAQNAAPSSAGQSYVVFGQRKCRFGPELNTR